MTKRGRSWLHSVGRKKPSPAELISQCRSMFSVCKSDAAAFQVQHSHWPKVGGVGGVTVTALKWAESPAKEHVCHTESLLVACFPKFTCSATLSQLFSMRSEPSELH